MKPPKFEYIIFGLFFLFSFHRIFFAGQIFAGRDLLELFIPFAHFISHTIHVSREMPLWNPYVFCGFPMVAEIQFSLFYPPNWPILFLSPERALTIITLLHLAIGAAGFCSLSRILNISRDGAVLGTIVFLFGSFVTSRYLAGNNVVVHSTMWTPLVFGRAMRCWKKPDLRNFALLSLACAALLLSGSPQIAFYVLFSLIVAVVYFSSLAFGKSMKKENDVPVVWLKPALLTLSAVGIAILLAFIQILPTLEWVKLTHERWSMNRWEFFSQGSMPPRMLLPFLFPTFYNHPAQLSYWGTRLGFHEVGFYAGALSVLFPLIVLPIRIRDGLFSPRGKYSVENNIYLLLIFILVLSVILAMGRHLPVYKILYDWIPGFDKFRYPARMLLLTHLSFSLLVAFCWHDLKIQFQASHGPDKRLIFQIACILSAILLLTVLLIWIMPSLLNWMIEQQSGRLVNFGNPRDPAIRFLLSARSSVLRFIMFFVFYGAILLLVMFKKIGMRAGWCLLAAILFFDLYSFGSPFILTASRETIRNRFFEESDLIRGLQYHTHRSRFLCLDEAYANNRESNYAAIFPNRPSIFMLNDVRGNDPMYPRYLTQLLNAMAGRETSEYAGSFLRVPEIVQPELLRYINAGIILTAANHYPQFPVLETFKGGLTVRRNPLPAEHEVLRSAIAGGSLSDRESISTLIEMSQNGRRECLINDLEQDTAMPSEGPQSGKVFPISISSTHRTYRVQVEDRRWFILSESYHPGWSAEIDGEIVDVHRANHAFMAVKLPQGIHTLEWRFRSASLKYGAMISGATLLLLIGLGADSAIRRVRSKE